ncbi:c-type cytochrome biogenesis protein CcmI [Photobacterium angustum]|uniref:c-type cytochrome biogenesis protein CcmI n=1 Tax=Photobacterium angustum TaxID=661 RepID=UPI0005E843BB|nr:c-type cytochrome biogenesis protein CcmI [Photobacterium angustum]KJG03697.1 cytochrome C heme lyase [Photobacterium angustum]KJG18610.1 cytochrome C heme lyase [Photobacterium angustum]KJG25828.1 cytochrome C heme lyase [Photobacterium angustum]KJG34012.1 cytochrome C heme lyase [Photobacterium angustum]KJG34775.1 cytochrome C heme lyase [Photobacterium angustum]
MTLFWIITAVLVLIAIAFFAVPMLYGKEYDDVASRDELNKAFFKDRIHELENESQEGLVENRQELVSELQQSLLDDIPESEVKKSVQVSAGMLLPGIILIVGVSYGMYASVGGIQKVEAWHDAVNRLPQLSQRLLGDNAANEPLSDQDMSDLTLALRTKLHDDGDDPMGWLLLGRIAMANRDGETAEMAMKKAYDLNPVDGDIQLGYAQSLMLSGKPGASDTARQLLRNVVKKDHTNVQALSLLAFDAFEQNKFEQAIAYWTMMKKLIGPDDSRAPMLDRSIERAQERLNADDKAKAIASGSAATATTEAAPKVGAEQAKQQVVATISLAPNVVMPKQGAIIISVHSADGAPMPIAAVKLPLTTPFPLTITLTDKDSMMPQRKLSSLNEMIVRARIDSDGNVMTKQGDWYGESQKVMLGGDTKVLINKQY